MERHGGRLWPTLTAERHAVYEVDLLPEASSSATALPAAARKILEEFLEVLEIQPYAGDFYRPPDSDLRTAVLASGQLLVIWLVLDDQSLVEVVRVMWLGSHE